MSANVFEMCVVYDRIQIKVTCEERELSFHLVDCMNAAVYTSLVQDQ